MSSKNEIEQLIFLFSKLPGLGLRSARRIVLHLLQDKDIRLVSLIEGLTNAAIKINNCAKCSNIDITEICNICLDETRDKSLICVVETVSELWAIERSNIFQGQYHVLGHYSSNAQNRTPAILKLPSLLQRCLENNVQELILATNATLDGQTTAYFIIEYFKNHQIIISRLASGIPVGGELDYFDEGTLSAAISLRRPFD